MSDEQPDDDYRLQARTLYSQLREERRAALGYQFDLGKWLIASLLIINGGALIAIGQRVSSDPTSLAAAPWFVGGIVLGMLCGLTTWVNASLLAGFYDLWAQPAMLIDSERWPEKQNSWKSKFMPWTFWGSLMIGIGSLACFVIGSISITHASAEAGGSPARPVKARHLISVGDRQ